MKIHKTPKSACQEKGEQVLQTKGIAIVGMSPGNSCFKQQIIDELIKFVAGRFPKVYVWIPDKPAEHTYKALGYTDQESKTKARQKGNNLKNHSRRTIEDIQANL